MLGKLSISACFNISYIMSAELNPTIMSTRLVRNVAVGAGSMWARIGGVVSPFVVYSKQLWLPLPFAIFGGCAVLAGVVAMALMETMGADLPETVEEAERFGTGGETVDASPSITPYGKRNLPGRVLHETRRQTSGESLGSSLRRSAVLKTVDRRLGLSQALDKWEDAGKETSLSIFQDQLQLKCQKAGVRVYAIPEDLKLLSSYISYKGFVVYIGIILQTWAGIDFGMIGMATSGVWLYVRVLVRNDLAVSEGSEKQDGGGALFWVSALPSYALVLVFLAGFVVTVYACRPESEFIVPDSKRRWLFYDCIWWPVHFLFSVQVITYICVDLVPWVFRSGPNGANCACSEIQAFGFGRTLSSSSNTSQTNYTFSAISNATNMANLYPDEESCALDCAAYLCRCILHPFGREETVFSMNVTTISEDIRKLYGIAVDTEATSVTVANGTPDVFTNMAGSWELWDGDDDRFALTNSILAFVCLTFIFMTLTVGYEGHRLLQYDVINPDPHLNHVCMSNLVCLTGVQGQLGAPLAEELRKKYGRDNVIATGRRFPDAELEASGPYKFLDVMNMDMMRQFVVDHRIDWVVHFSALLSVIGESNVPLAIQINIESVHNMLELCKNYNLRLFLPSTIGAFGPTSPRNPTPDLCIQRPRTIYGVAKVHAELMGEYYNHRFGLDFRSARFPGVISAETMPGGGTTDYAVAIFHDAIQTGKFECYLRPDTRLPMMYLPDCIRATVEMLEAPDEDWKLRTYNITAMSFTPEEIAEELKKHIPNLEVTYKPDDRQQIADTWPEVFDDSGARNDLGWNHEYDLAKMVETMVTRLRQKYGK
uniref:L-threonine 3-dehydrogenase, mitochondrial n=1 Tax=Branchiostoma floridae TaxID=7739 RepID=C3ZUH8_BRAFL|eukprot:XP_002587806.1 hypothetical protein BRAFLDRAFT_92255 [Branchiostoma floridae]